LARSRPRPVDRANAFRCALALFEELHPHAGSIPESKLACLLRGQDPTTGNRKAHFEAMLSKKFLQMSLYFLNWLLKGACTYADDGPAKGLLSANARKMLLHHSRGNP
jgi:hypothetical protein